MRRSIGPLARSALLFGFLIFFLKNPLQSIHTLLQYYHISMSASRAYFAKFGIVGQVPDPVRNVIFARTYVHPETKQEVTLQPIPPVARRQFWEEACTDLHRKYDLVLFEDGQQPLSQPGDSFRRFFRDKFPFINHRQYVPRDSMEQYVGKTTVDSQDGAVAMSSISKRLDPPIDPRARRGVEHLRTLDPSRRVVMPWSFVHMPYLIWKLKELGYVEQRCAQTTMVTNDEAKIVTVLAVAFGVMLPMYIVYNFFSSVMSE